MTNTKLPAEIKVASHMYKVSLKDREWYHESGKRGECDKNETKIWISEGMTVSRTVETFIHEILHAVYYEYGIQDEDEEERIVTALATGFSQVIKDNPELLKYLTRVPK